jgi:hypothetical protein
MQLLLAKPEKVNHGFAQVWIMANILSPTFNNKVLELICGQLT